MDSYLFPSLCESGSPTSLISSFGSFLAMPLKKNSEINKYRKYNKHFILQNNSALLMNKDKKEVKANIWQKFKISMKEDKYTDGAKAINNDNIRVLTLQLLKMIVWRYSSRHFAPAVSTPMRTHLSVSGGLSH